MNIYFAQKLKYFLALYCSIIIFVSTQHKHVSYITHSLRPSPRPVPVCITAKFTRVSCLPALYTNIGMINILIRALTHIV